MTKTKKDLYPTVRKYDYIVTVRTCDTCKEPMECNQWQKTKKYCCQECQLRR